MERSQESSDDTSRVNDEGNLVNTPTVSAAKAEDRERVVSAIVLAFVSDPVARWAWPEPHHYLTYFAEFTTQNGPGVFYYI